VTKLGKLSALVCLGSVGGCATVTADGPAWYCTGTARVGEVEGLSTANLNADGTVFYTSRDWRFGRPVRDRPALFVTGSGDEVQISVPIGWKHYFKYVYRVEVRLDSVENPPQDSSMIRDDPRNGSNVYTFARGALIPHKNQRVFFVALDRDGRVWWSVPLDLSIIDRGETAMGLADAKLSTMRADFSKRCVSRKKAEKAAGVIIA
jgi:hypothetical protein